MSAIPEFICFAHLFRTSVSHICFAHLSEFVRSAFICYRCIEVQFRDKCLMSRDSAVTKLICITGVTAHLNRRCLLLLLCCSSATAYHYSAYCNIIARRHGCAVCSRLVKTKQNSQRGTSDAFPRTHRTRMFCTTYLTCSMRHASRVQMRVASAGIYKVLSGLDEFMSPACG